jgi:hypothetical protein
MSESVSCPNCSANVPPGARFCQVCGTAIASPGQHHAKPVAAKKPVKHKKPSAGKSQWTVVLAGTLVVLLLSFLAMTGISRMNQGKTAGSTLDHDMTAMLKSAGPMPDWLASAPKDTIANYAWAVSHHDELQYFPCFCGCFNSAGHVSNSECYYQRDAGKNVRAYDPHAFG